MIDAASFLDKNGNPSSRKISLAADNLVAATTWMSADASLVERLWYLYHKHTSYVAHCNTCKKVLKWKSWHHPYPTKFCSASCWQVHRRITSTKVPKPKLSKEEKIKRRESANLKRYGVRYPWMLDDYKQQRSVKKKEKSVLDWIKQLKARGLEPLFSVSDYLDGAASRENLLVRCGCGTEFSLQRYKENSVPRLCPMCYTPSASRWQHEINDFVKSLGFRTRINDRRTLGEKLEIDIYIPSLRLGIECDGAWWHSEGGRPDIKKAMLKKLAQAHAKGIRIVSIFDFEWEEKQEIVKSRLSAILGKAQRLYARTLQIKELSKAEAARFFNATHLQGAGKGRTYGLLTGETICAAMCVSRPRFAKGIDLEIIRYSSALNITVVGGASKLFSHIIQNFNPTSVVSYADVRFGQGEMYQKLNFVDDGVTGESFFYITSSGSRRSRQQMQKLRLPAIIGEGVGTEKEQAQKAGWYRVWVPGSRRWIWRASVTQLSFPA